MRRTGPFAAHRFGHVRETILITRNASDAKMLATNRAGSTMKRSMETVYCTAFRSPFPPGSYAAIAFSRSRSNGANNSSLLRANPKPMSILFVPMMMGHAIPHRPNTQTAGRPLPPGRRSWAPSIQAGHGRHVEIATNLLRRQAPQRDPELLCPCHRCPCSWQTPCPPIPPTTVRWATQR